MYRCAAEIAFERGFTELAGARVAVIGNPTSLIRQEGGAGRLHLVDALRGAGVNVVRLFGPEHGMWATAQDMIGVENGVDPAFLLPVASLYGSDEESLKPNLAALDGVDAVVFDVQDVGARYYTYAATLCMAIDVCAEAGVRVVVLDRANPLGGEVVEGGAIDDGFYSFVGWINIPQRHGLTVGEIACLHAEEAGRPRPHVIRCAGWETDKYLDELPEFAGLSAWTCPSPNMPTMQTAALYPGGCLIEGTTLSEGRGTTRPFELVGAPGLPPHAYAAKVQELAGPGLIARPYVFEPTFQKHAGEVCGGAALEIVDRKACSAVRAGLATIEAARIVAPDVVEWRSEVYEFVADRLAFDLLMGGVAARRALEAGHGIEAAMAGEADAVARFVVRARPHLLYPRSSGVFAAG